VKKVFAAFLVCCFLFVVTGHYFVFLLHVSQVKKEMKEELKGGWIGKTTTLIFTEKEFASLAWEEEQEFRWKGDMFDVISKSRKEGRITIHCIPDKKETELLDAYQNWLKTEKGLTRSFSLLKLFYSPFTTSDEPFLCFDGTEIHRVFARYAPFLEHTKRDVPKQPPRMAPPIV
jgi:hypothetical protein